MITKEDIDQGFYDRAVAELRKLRITAMEFMQRYPGCSKKRLAEIIGNGVTSRGLTMKLFEEAHHQSTVKTLAKELFYRKIVNEFPNGWHEGGKVRATIKIGGWRHDVLEFAPEFGEHATAIIKALATTDKPATGWKPQSPDDERLRFLFDKYWNACE